ncbi:MAG TPA: CvpA family protein [Candidatus Omnitrophota bacterium]|nr:CvpA family protein [Candidatus Omnitrophota bacterium]
MEKLINPIDLGVCLILGLYFINGARKGLLKTLLGPIAFIIGTLIAVVYYLNTHLLINTLLISILSPFALNILFFLILKFWNKTIQKGETISPLSRLLGGLMAILWSGAWVLCLLIFLALIPAQTPWFNSLQEQISASKACGVARRLIGHKIPESSTNITKLTEILENPDKYAALKDLKEYQDLINDPALNELLSDTTSTEQMKNRDFPGLLSNPKFQALLQNKDLIKKILALNEKIADTEMKETD